MKIADEKNKTLPAAKQLRPMLSRRSVITPNLATAQNKSPQKPIEH